MAFLTLTNSAKIVLIDDDTPELITCKKWRLTNHGYVVHGRWSVQIHRAILNLEAFNGDYVDHINGDPLDNRKSNLRICSSAQNSFNKGMNSRNKTGFKGVSVFSSRNCFRSVIQRDRKYMHLGYFPTPEEAARAYDKAAKELHGEFARLNFPEERSA